MTSIYKVIAREHRKDDRAASRHFVIKIMTLSQKLGSLVWQDYAPELLKRRRPLSILIFDLKSHMFLNVSDAAVQQYGYSREEFLLMPVKRILNKGSIVKFLGYARHIGTLPTSTGVWKHHKKDGTGIDMEVLCVKFVFLGRAAILMLANETSDPMRLDNEITGELRDYLTGGGRSLEIVTRTQRQTNIVELDREMAQLGAMSDDALVWKTLTAPPRR
jgi:hypothetical protein